MEYGFEVIFKETVFFPEGGGQNTDKGWIMKTFQHPHFYVDPDSWIHFVNQPDPSQIYDWEIRSFSGKKFKCR